MSALATVAASADREPSRAGRIAAAEASASLGRNRTASVVLFASRAHGVAAVRVAQGAAQAVPTATIVVIPGHGVLARSTELEDEPAVVALALATPITASIARRTAAAPAAQGRMLGELVATTRREPILCFAEPDAFSGEWLDGFAAAVGPRPIVGGGTLAGSTFAMVRPGGQAETGAFLAARVDGGIRAAMARSPGVRLLTEMMTIDAMEGGFVTRLGGRPPLEILSDAMRLATKRTMVLLAVPRLVDGEEELVVRGISGVDPPRGAIHVGETISRGDRIAFACLDPDASRRSLQSAMARLESRLAGGVPIACLYVTCVGRGQTLYGSPHVDSRIVRSRFPDVPVAGVFATFELASFGDRPERTMYSGVPTMLYVPS